MAGILLKGIRTAAKTAKNPLADLAAYPILTEEVGYPPSPLASPSSTSKGGGTGSAAPLGQIVNKAVSEVLGWKIKAGDAAHKAAADKMSKSTPDEQKKMMAEFERRFKSAPNA